MDLSQADIKRLYGDVFFLIKEKEEEIIVPESVTAEETQDRVEEVAQTFETKPTPIPEPPKEVVQAPAEEKPAESQAIEDPFEKYLGLGPMTNWKLKAQSELALIVLQSEFSDKNAMANLKNLVVGAGIDTSKIGFGVIEDGRSGWNFSDMPVSKGIVFASFPERLPSPVEWKGKQLYAAAPMKLIIEDERYSKAMDRLLQKVRDSL